MAWIAKQSANTKLQKRDVPYLTPVLMDKLPKILCLGMQLGKVL